MLLEVDRLTVRYGRECGTCVQQASPGMCPNCGSVLACKDLTFDLEPGETVGIVGESGSGKSTVIRCINLDLEPTSGSITLSGMNLASVQGRRRRLLRAEQLGIVHQNPHEGLDFGVSAGGNVVRPLLDLGWRRYHAARRRAEHLLDEVELPRDRLDTSVREFSGGMRQRVQLAKALASEPRLLLLDEPTSGLDASVQARILDLIRRLQRDTAIATVLVSHDLAVIRMLAERTVVMRGGQVVEAGLTDQILTDPCHPYTQLLVSAQLQ